MSRTHSESGQASVEFVALLPLVAVIGFALWQAMVAGEAALLAGSSARAAARAGAVGADPRAAACAWRRSARPRTSRCSDEAARAGGCRGRSDAAAAVPGRAGGLSGPR